LLDDRLAATRHVIAWRPSDHGGRLDTTPDDWGIAQEGPVDAGSLDDSSTPEGVTGSGATASTRNGGDPIWTAP